MSASQWLVVWKWGLVDIFGPNHSWISVMACQRTTKSTDGTHVGKKICLRHLKHSILVQIALIVKPDTCTATYSVDTSADKWAQTHTYRHTRTVQHHKLLFLAQDWGFWHDNGIYNSGISKWPPLENRLIIQFELGKQCADTSGITKWLPP